MRTPLNGRPGHTPYSIKARDEASKLPFADAVKVLERENAALKAQRDDLSTALRELYEWCDTELTAGERPERRLSVALAALHGSGPSAALAKIGGAK